MWQFVNFDWIFPGERAGLAVLPCLQLSQTPPDYSYMLNAQTCCYISQNVELFLLSFYEKKDQTIDRKLALKFFGLWLVAQSMFFVD